MAEIIKVENKGGVGNELRFGAGDPKGGQFAPKNATGSENSDTETGFMDLSSMLDLIKESTIPDIKVDNNLSPEDINYIKSEFYPYLSENEQLLMNSLDKETKISNLVNLKIGLDDETLGKLSDEEINCIFCSQIISVKNQEETSFLDFKIDIQEKYLQQFVNEKPKLEGVWYGSSIGVDQYATKKELGSFDSKIDWYQNYEPDKEKAAQKLAELAEFEKNGLEYEQEKNNLNSLLQEKEKTQSFKEISDKAKNFLKKVQDPKNIYSDERKNNATWIKGENVVKKSLEHFGPKFEKMWESMSKEERYAIKDYTGGGYSKYNKPLRGLKHSGWSHFDFEHYVTNMTNAIDKCVWDEDIWVQRGVEKADLFAINGDYNNLKSLNDFISSDNLQSLVGTVFKEKGFYSSGAGKGTGFSSNSIILNTYCPMGTKMAYMNTKGYFANGHENEMILQRGYSYRITKVKKDAYGGKFYIDCEVLLGTDENKPTGSALKELGKKYLGSY